MDVFRLVIYAMQPANYFLKSICCHVPFNFKFYIKYLTRLKQLILVELNICPSFL